MASSALLKFIRHRWPGAALRWEPFVALYYLTYACDFRCPYCANGEGIPYHRLPITEADAATALRILARIRQHTEHVVLTGGEPLLHKEAGSILSGLSALKFKSVTLTTNGEHIQRYLPEIAKHIDILGVSLDTLEEKKADAWFGKGTDMLAQILANIAAAADYPKRRFDILISAVATPNNIDDLYAVYAYAQRNGFQFSASPELHGITPPAKLRENSAYQRFFAFLQQEKANGARIFGSRDYLAHMGNFQPFKCHPLTTLSVDPQGNVFYPCLEKAHRVGNLLESDLLTLRRHAQTRLGLSNQCEHACHSACALGLSLLINQPWAETVDFLRSALPSKHATPPDPEA